MNTPPVFIIQKQCFFLAPLQDTAVEDRIINHYCMDIVSKQNNQKFWLIAKIPFSTSLLVGLQDASMVSFNPLLSWKLVRHSALPELKE